ncbi:hypothetical protein LCGC14_0446940 [marine sediment metagenome]|uniref:Uncharacterized protein n=1 Tax=marine sediment metagenome TaxID=412755 RepID=A0A0F9VT41_9ZZZZ
MVRGGASVICARCKLEESNAVELPDNPTLYTLCKFCHRRLPEGKVYHTREVARIGKRWCIVCDVSVAQIGKYCCYCIDHKPGE